VGFVNFISGRDYNDGHHDPVGQPAERAGCLGTQTPGM
jgi:hypothetical protein